MLKIIILFALYLIIISVSCTNIQNIQRPNRQIDVVDPEYAANENRISKTFEEIIKNITDNGDYAKARNNGSSVIQFMLSMNVDQIREIPRNNLLSSLWAIGNLKLPKHIQFAIWDVIRGDNQINELTNTQLENLSEMLSEISEMDLVNLNVTDLNIVEFLGTFSKWTNRQSGILAFALKLEDEQNNTCRNTEFVNKIKGLLCGFGETYLAVIPPENLKNISGEVFNNLWSCSPEQIKILLELAKHPKAYGLIPAWNEETTNKLGLLLTAFEGIDFKRLPFAAFRGISPHVLKRLTSKQLTQFSQLQVNALKSDSFAIYQANINELSGSIQYQSINVGVLLSVIIFIII